MGPMASSVLSTIRSRVPCRTSVLPSAMSGPPSCWLSTDIRRGCCRAVNKRMAQTLLHFHGHGDLRVLPLQHQVGGVIAGLFERDRKLFDWLLKRLFLHVNPRQVLIFVVNRAPLARLLPYD